MIRIVSLTVRADKSPNDSTMGILRDVRSDVREAFPGWVIADVLKVDATTATFRLELEKGE